MRGPYDGGVPLAGNALLGAALLFGGAVALAATAPRASDDFATDVRPLLTRYCGECHGASEPQADLALLTLAGAPDERETWELVRDVLRYDEMPPEGHARPSASERDAISAWIGTLLGDADAGGPAPDAPIDPGPAPLRRLSNAEYENTVRDLFGLAFDARERFPSDSAGAGFDNDGGALSVSPLLFEHYVDAAGEIAARAIVVDDTRVPSERRFEATELDAPDQGHGAAALYSRSAAVARFEAPRAGTYRVRVRAFADQAGPEVARMALVVDGRTETTFDVAAERAAPGTFERAVELGAGRRDVAASFVNDYWAPDDPDASKRDRNLYVRWIEVAGPLDPPPPSAFQVGLFERFGPELGRRRLDALLEHLVERVWRRPATRIDLSRLRRFVADEETLEAQARRALEALLASPSFVYRIELDPPPGRAPAVRALEGHELATRLSYFLWSSAPDEELLEHAAAGALADDEALAAEVERMLADPRSAALAERFAAQWLQIERLDAATPDPERFDAFDEELRAAMGAETRLFFDRVLRADRSLWELLDADWTFANERLARHYEIEGVRGDAMQIVSLAGTDRRGLLGHGSVLVSTSDPTRTSPTKRGKWILDALLGEPPPPPLPGVDSLGEDAAALSAASLRERLEQHRADPACAACHARMDPLGFALETYDAVGRLRADVDASGELPDGRTFEGPLELAATLRADGRLPQALTEKMLVYALGRGLERSDRPTVYAVLARLDEERPTLRQLVHAIVSSDAFRTRRADTR